MNSFELNKVMGALLGCLLALLSLNIAAGALFTAHKPEKPGYNIVVEEKPDAKAGGPAAPAEVPLAQRLASADIGKGENSAKKCAACHTFGKGEPNRVGPNLYGVVGRQKTSEPGFNYSAAFKALKGTWTPEELDHYLTKPQAMVPGTNMTFAGLPRGTERADVIAFLNSKSDKPVAFPKEAAGDAKPDQKAADQNAPAPNAPAANTPAPNAGEPKKPE
jgi:cytochrome c